MENLTTENGSWAARTDLEFGKELIMTLIWDNGKIIKLGDMESIIGQMVTNMKANGKPQSKTAKEQISSQTKTSTPASTRTANLTATASTDGVKVPPTSASSLLE
jgi:hypothetical protein